MRVSDPYRSGAGTPCPRCEIPLLRERDDELACGDGCGTWLGNACLPLSAPALMASSRRHPLSAKPLPPTKCLVCKRSLLDLYNKADVDVLTIGQCLEHGIWIERGDRAKFEAAYGEAIRDHEADVAAQAIALANRQAELEHKHAELANQQFLASLPSVVASLVKRVEALENTVEDLERQLATKR